MTFKTRVRTGYPAEQMAVGGWSNTSRGEKVRVL